MTVKAQLIAHLSTDHQPYVNTDGLSELTGPELHRLHLIVSQPALNPTHEHTEAEAIIAKYSK